MSLSTLLTFSASRARKSYRQMAQEAEEAARMIDHCQAPSKQPVIWYHLCRYQRMDNIPMVRGTTCECGARSPQHDLGPYDEDQNNA